MRIALVDDSEIERGILLSLITDYGCEKQILFESDCFDSGDAFLSSFSSDKYDIVFPPNFFYIINYIITCFRFSSSSTRSTCAFLPGAMDPTSS